MKTDFIKWMVGYAEGFEYIEDDRVLSDKYSNWYFKKIKTNELTMTKDKNREPGE